MRVELHVEASTRNVGDFCRAQEVEKPASHNIVPVDPESRSNLAEQCVLCLPTAGRDLHLTQQL